MHPTRHKRPPQACHCHSQGRRRASRALRACRATACAMRVYAGQQGARPLPTQPFCQPAPGLRPISASPPRDPAPDPPPGLSPQSRKGMYQTEGGDITLVTTPASSAQPSQGSAQPPLSVNACEMYGLPHDSTHVRAVTLDVYSTCIQSASPQLTSALLVT